MVDRGSRPPLAVLAGAAVLAVVGAVYAVGRWPGGVPIGSDNDEYLDVGSRLAELSAPLSAGVEGTKYPLGYPALLALIERLGLPPGGTAQALNLVALVAVVGLLGWIVGRPMVPGGRARPAAGFAASGTLLASTALWRDVYSVMPEILTVLVVVVALGLVTRAPTGRRVAAMTAVAVAAVLLKTLAILVIGGLTVGAALWTLSRHRTGGEFDGPVRSIGPDGAAPTWWRWLVPPAVATVVVGAGTVLMGRYPPHTTGYLEMFFLRDPNDASRGELDGLGGLIARTAADVPDTVRDLGLAITLPEADRTTAIVVALVLLTVGAAAAFRLFPATPAGPAVTVAVLIYAAGLSFWPYHAPRFGLPLLPVAALGTAWLVDAASQRLSRPAGWVVAAAAVTAAVAIGLPPALEEGTAERERIPAYTASVEGFAAWADTEVAPDEQLVSFDYREISRRLDRPVQPLGYTTDPDALLEATEGADVVVAVRGLYGRRTDQFDRLVDVHGNGWELVFDDGTTVAYRR